MSQKKELKSQSKSSVEDSIELRPEEEWENEDRSLNEKDLSISDLSETAISYLAQIQDLQEQLEQEYLKVQRLEMAIRGFSIALEEEVEKGQQPLFYCHCLLLVAPNYYFIHCDGPTTCLSQRNSKIQIACIKIVCMGHSFS